MKSNQTQKSAARAATIDELLTTTVPLFLSPAPSAESLKNWLDDARIPRFKANPTAKRGGGTCWYSVAAVEKFLRERTMPA